MLVKDRFYLGKKRKTETSTGAGGKPAPEEIKVSKDKGEDRKKMSNSIGELQWVESAAEEWSLKHRQTGVLGRHLAVESRESAGEGSDLLSLLVIAEIKKSREVALSG